MMKPVRSKISLLLITVYALFVLPLCAQNPLGSVRGTVQDGAGARIPQAKVSLNNAEKSLTRNVKSDAQGEFRAEDLPAGSYQVTANAVGFASAHAEVSVAVSSSRQITITLRPSSVSQKIIVDGTASVTPPELQTESAWHQTVIYRQLLNAIPLPPPTFPHLTSPAPA